MQSCGSPAVEELDGALDEVAQVVVQLRVHLGSKVVPHKHCRGIPGGAEYQCRMPKYQCRMPNISVACLNISVACLNISVACLNISVTWGDRSLGHKNASLQGVQEESIG